MSYTPAQRDGRSCIVCDGFDGAMIPAGMVDGCQVFVHPACDEPAPAPSVPTVLVVGDATSPVALEDLEAFAHDCADRLQVPAKVAIGRDYDVTEYAGVVLDATWLDSVDSAVLGVEAQEADMFCIDAETLRAYESSRVCNHCYEDAEASPMLVGDTWTTAVCRSCVDVHVRGGLPVGVLPAIV
ncbi:hypothetical protein ACIQ6R_14095 [Streptomyces sp. NPDC096048]|uniref:hypothetical protein n=1 Tax=Streptomyces sp. NPDC096048 TaxID=3366072 RepID=UPI00382CC943